MIQLSLPTEDKYWELEQMCCYCSANCCETLKVREDGEKKVKSFTSQTGILLIKVLQGSVS